MRRFITLSEVVVLVALLLLLSGCINRHTFAVQEGVYSSSSISEIWSENFTINEIRIELTSISEEIYTESGDNVFYTDLDVKKYYMINIVLYDENNVEQQINVEDFHMLDMFNGYGFYFEQDNERYVLKLILEVDGEDYDDELVEGTLCNGLSVTIMTNDNEYYDFELTLDDSLD